MKSVVLTSTGLILMACSTVPQAITVSEALSHAEELRTELSAQREPVTQSISLYEGMARALKYNLNHRVSMMEIDL